MNAPSTEQQGKGRSLWPLAIIGFFAAAILGFVGFIVFCQFNKSELVASDYYEQEIRYQAELDRLSRAQPLGDRISATFRASTRRLSVALRRNTLLPAPRVSFSFTGLRRPVWTGLSICVSNPTARRRSMRVSCGRASGGFGFGGRFRARNTLWSANWRCPRD